MLKDIASSTAFLIKQLPTATVFADKNFRVVHASDTWLATYGQCPISAVGSNIFDLFEDLNQKWQSIFQACLRGKSNTLGIQAHTNDLGQRKWYEWSCAPWYDADEDIKGTIIQTHDVSESILTEMELEKQDTLLRQQSEISKIGRWEYDVAKDQLYWCEMTKKIHGVSHLYEPNVENAIAFYKKGHSQNAVAMALYEAREHGREWRLKLQIETAQGLEKWVMSAGKPIYENGKLARIIGAFQDIDDQVVAHLEIKKSEKLLRTLVDNVPLNIFVKDRESRKILVNKAECQYHNAAKESDLLGKDNYDLYDEKTADIFTAQDKNILST